MNTEPDAALLAGIIDTLPIGVLVLDPDGRVALCNEPLGRLTGAGADSPVGHHYAEVIAGFEERGGRITDARGKTMQVDEHPVMRCRASGVVVTDELVGMAHQGAGGMWLRVSARPLRGDGGGPAGAERAGSYGVVATVRDVTRRRAAELEALARLDGDRMVLDALGEGVTLFAADGSILFANKAAARLLGLRDGWMEGKRREDLVRHFAERGLRIWNDAESPMSFDDLPAMQTIETGVAIHDFVAGFQTPVAEEPVWLEITTEPLCVEGEEHPYAVVQWYRDVSGHRRNQAELEGALEKLCDEREFLRVLLDNLEEGIVAVDANGGFTVFNPASRRFHNITDTEALVGKVPSGSDLFTPAGEHLPPEDNPVLRALRGEDIRNEHLVVAPRGGARRDVLVNAQVLSDASGAKIGAVAAMHDVTDQKRFEARLADMALRDPLTGAANRILLMDRIERAFERARRDGNAVAVFLLDLDDFKAVNDSMGHGAGDEVLVTVAERLRAAMRPTDTIARLGGDEFVVVCNLDGNTTDVRPVLQRLEAVFAMPVRVRERNIALRTSIGGGVRAPGDDVTPEQLLIQADDAMYRVKAEHHRG